MNENIDFLQWRRQNPVQDRRSPQQRQRERANIEQARRDGTPVYQGGASSSQSKQAVRQNRVNTTDNYYGGELPEIVVSAPRKRQTINKPTATKGRVTTRGNTAAQKPITGKQYTVQYGDTLSSIARRAGMSVKEIAQLNNIADINKIKAGQVLNFQNTATRNAVKRALAQEQQKTIANNIASEDELYQAAVLGAARQQYLQDLNNTLRNAVVNSAQNYEPAYFDFNQPSTTSYGYQQPITLFDRYMYQ